MPLRAAQGDRLGRAGTGLCVPLQGLPAAHRHRLPSRAAAWPRSQVRIEGEHKIYGAAADSGSEIRFHFCPNCGSSVYWEGERNPSGCGVAAAAFADPDLPPPTSSVFEEDMHAWLGLPTVQRASPAGPPAGRELRRRPDERGSRHPYETGLDKNPANFVPLSPIGFLLRSAAVYPERTAVIHGERRYTWRQKPRALPPPGVGAGGARRRPRRHGGGDGAQRAGSLRGAFRRADGRRRLNMLNIRLDAETIAFILKHGEREGADHRHRICPGDRPRPRAARRQAAGHRHRRSRGARRRKRAWARSITRRSSPRATPISPGSPRATNGTRSRSTTPRAPPATRRASSTPIAAPI